MTWLQGVLIVGGTTLIVVLLFLLMLRLFPDLRHEDNNEILTQAFLVFSALYAVILAFIAVTIWEEFSAAKRTTQTEASALSSVMHDAGAFAKPETTAIRADVLDYARLVVNNEWLDLGHGKANTRTDEAYSKIWNDLYTIHSMSNSEQQFLNASADAMNVVSAARQDRIEASTTTIPLILWILIIIGAVVTFVLLYFFWAPSEIMQLGVLIAGGIFIGFAIFLIYALQHPYSGSVSVKPEAFRNLLEQWSGRV